VLYLRWVRWTYLPAALFVLSILTSAQTTDSQGAPLGGDNLFSRPLDLVHRLDEGGISVKGTFVYDWSKPSDGDLGTDRGFGRYSFDLSTAVDGRTLGLEGSTGFVRIKAHENHFGETYDGGAQLYSNIDAPSRTTLYELWLEQRLFSNKLRIKGGKVDANTEFAVVQGAGDFLNSSMGFSPTIMSFPSYPEPKLSLSGFFYPSETHTVGLGFFQTAGSSTLLIIEPGQSWQLAKGEQPGRISLGYWRLDGSISRLNGTYAKGAQGFYSVVEQAGWHHPWVGADGERKLSTFLQIGTAENQVNSFTRHAGGGGVVQRPFHGRPLDSFGVAATWVRFSSVPQAGFVHSAELVVEAYYRATLNSHVSLVQDLQHLHHPGGMRAYPDCLMITPRLIVSF
jgi:porin